MTDRAGTPAFSDAGVREWNGHVEAVLRGFAHALNNRAAALSAVLELSAGGDDDPEGTRSILASELERVRELGEIIRHVGPPRGGEEAFEPGESALHASAVLKLHADHRDRTVVVQARHAPPVRLIRWMFVRALVVLGASARSAQAPSASPVILEIDGDGDWLSVRATDVNVAETPTYLGELVLAMGGEMIGPLEFRVRTLDAVRRREGR